MGLLDRLLRTTADARGGLRPLWHRVVAISREPEWYAECGVADSVPGRFDMITTMLALVLLRLERDDDRDRESALLTELFVEDMDGQLRESGVGDMVVGKHMGRLMAALGGRIGAYRDAFAGNDDALEKAVARNVTLVEGADARALAARLRALAAQLDQTATGDLLAARLAR